MEELKKSRAGILPGYVVVKTEYWTHQEEKGKHRKPYHVVKDIHVLPQTAREMVAAGKTADGKTVSINWDKMSEQGLSIPGSDDVTRLHMHEDGTKPHPVTYLHTKRKAHKASMEEIARYWELSHDKDPDRVNLRLHAHPPYNNVHPVSKVHNDELSQIEHNSEKTKFEQERFGTGYNKKKSGSIFENPHVIRTNVKVKFRGEVIPGEKIGKGKLEAYLWEWRGGAVIRTPEGRNILFSGKRPLVDANKKLEEIFSDDNIKKSLDNMRADIIKQIQHLSTEKPISKTDEVVLNKYQSGDDEIVLAGLNGKYSVTLNDAVLLNDTDFTKAIAKFYKLISATIKSDASDKDMALEIFGDRVMQINRTVRPMIDRMGDTKAAMFLFDFNYDQLDYPFDEETFLKAELPRTISIGMVPTQNELNQGTDDKGETPSKKGDQTVSQDNPKELCQKPIETKNDRSINPVSIMS